MILKLRHVSEIHRSDLWLKHTFISGGLGALVHCKVEGLRMVVVISHVIRVWGGTEQQLEVTSAGGSPCHRSLSNPTFADITEQTFCYTNTFTELIISICLLPLLACRSRACNIRDASGKAVLFLFAVAVVDSKYMWVLGGGCVI